MTDETFPRLLWSERRSTSYPLPPGADVLVRPGQGIGRDALLARIPRTPLIEPYVSDLDTSPSEATIALSIKDGTRVRGGETVARRRSRLRTHTLNAATNGIISMRAGNGLYTLAPVVPTEIVARFGGTVTSVTLDAITVISVIERLQCSLASADATAEGSLLMLENPRALSSVATPDVALIPHLAALASLRELTRAGVTLVVACTVTDDVAWEVLTARTRGGGVAPHTPHIAAVVGPGELAEGARIFQALRAWDGRETWLEEVNGALMLCTEGRAGRPASSAAPTSLTLRDPAHWGRIAVIVLAERPDQSRAQGLTRTMRIPHLGQMDVPTQNVGVLVDE